ncbi:hypothetical protein [Paraburkholderia tropica]|uniref:hypothetical protein n=1 Tax=Paraburkholderia tropica TaxID=92647 RepID=UPI001CC4382B|nr:hypothetical protein [Paraburkholderia tropica]
MFEQCRDARQSRTVSIQRARADENDVVLGQTKIRFECLIHIQHVDLEIRMRDETFERRIGHEIARRLENQQFYGLARSGMANAVKALHADRQLLDRQRRIALELQFKHPCKIQQRLRVVVRLVIFEQCRAQLRNIASRCRQT